MKKTLLMITAFLAVHAFSQTVIFSEDFEGEDLSGWQVGDLDGDGRNWELLYSSSQAEEQGWGANLTLMLGSFGYDLTPGQESALSPDNLIITPAIELPANSNIQFDFKVGTNVDYLNNHNFQIFVVEDFTTFDESWTPFYEQNFEGISTAQDISLDLSPYAGSAVNIVFRHYNSDSQFVLLLDDLVITDNGVLAVDEFNNDVELSVYPNPVTDKLVIKSAEEVQAVEVFDAVGKLVGVYASQNEINVANLPKGVYLLNVKTTKRIEKLKFIKK